VPHLKLSSCGISWLCMCSYSLVVFLFDAGVETGADVRNASQRAGNSRRTEGLELRQSGTHHLRALAARIQSFGPSFIPFQFDLSDFVCVTGICLSTT